MQFLFLPSALNGVRVGLLLLQVVVGRVVFGWGKLRHHQIVVPVYHCEKFRQPQFWGTVQCRISSHKRKGQLPTALFLYPLAHLLEGLLKNRARVQHFHHPAKYVDAQGG